MKKAAALVAGLLLCGAVAAQARGKDTIAPGEPWTDNKDHSIQAHGGSILRVGDVFYWFGEDRSETNMPGKRYVSCYASRDLVHWKTRGQVLALANPEGKDLNFVLERPKVFYNEKTQKYVMYFHLDDEHYKVAKVGVAVSNKVDGAYTFVRSFRPLGQESRDIGQFVDDDGSAYLIFESRPTHGFFIAKLSDDYLNVDREMAFLGAPLEGGALAHYNGLYYVIGSHLTGWKPNPNVYATAPSLNGPWTEFKDIAPPATNTYGSQSTMLLKVVGSKATTVIYLGDIWNPKALWDSRYLWMPLEIGDGKLTLPAPHEWMLDAKTGEVQTADK